MAREFGKWSDNELQAHIAKRLGYKTRRADINSLEAYVLILPNGSEYGQERGLRVHKYVADDLFTMLDRWVNSVDVALTLLPMDRMWRIETYGKSLDVEIFPDDGERGNYSHAEIITVRQPRERLARAICEAWAVMMEATD